MRWENESLGELVWLLKMTQVEIVGGNKEEGKNPSSPFAFFSQAKTETSTSSSSHYK